MIGQNWVMCPLLALAPISGPSAENRKRGIVMRKHWVLLLKERKAERGWVQATDIPYILVQLVLSRILLLYDIF